MAGVYLSSYFLCIAISFVAVFGKTNYLSRQLHTECLCPCNTLCQNLDNGSYINLYHSTAIGPHDTLHYVVSTLGFPGLLVALTDINVTLHVDFQSFVSNSSLGSIKFSKEPHYVYTVEFTKLLEYNDTDDNANLSSIPPDPSLWRTYDLAHDLLWSNSSNFSVNNTVIFRTQDSDTVGMTTDDEDDGRIKFLANGSISISFEVTGQHGRDEQLPSLKHTPNSTQISLVLDNVQPSFTNSRFALEMAVVTSEGPGKGKVGITTHRSIDDEHSPGVFDVIDLTTHSDNQESGCYLQWKPVSYKSSKHSVKTSTKAKYYTLQSPDVTRSVLSTQQSLASDYFGEMLNVSGRLVMTMYNLSFGLSQDKFYTSTNYTSWTLTAAYGKPPEETVSTLIITIITVCLGIPILLLLFGGLGLCIWKNKKAEPTSAYTAIN